MTPEETLRSIQLEIARRRGADDPVLFAKSLGLNPDPWQERVLRWKGKRLLLNNSRQAGKSTISAVLALHRALYTPKSLVLLISPSLRQSQELFTKVTDLMREMPVKPVLEEDNKLSMRLPNGSRIVSLPSNPDTIRGFSAVSLLIEDEAGMVRDELYTAIRPMLAVSNGQLMLMSTPKGRKGHFFEAWETGGDVWERIKVTGPEVSRISPDFLKDEERALGLLYRQEYMGEFLHAATGRVYDQFDPGRNSIPALPGRVADFSWLLGIDFGVKDKTAFTLLGWREHDSTAYIAESYGHSDMAPSDVAEEYKRINEAYRLQRVVGDLGGLGKGFAQEMITRHNIPIEAAEKQNKAGYLRLMNNALRDGEIRIVAPSCPQLAEEWLTLPWAGNGQKEADGYAADCSDSALYVWRAAYSFLEQPAPVKLVPGTPEFYADIQHRLEEQDDQQDAGW